MNNKARQFIFLFAALAVALITLASGLTTLANAQTVTGNSQSYTVDVNIVGNGSVSKQPQQDTYTAGSVVTLTAVANTGWKFNGWSGDLTGAQSPAQITVNSNREITATFQQRCYTLNLSHSGEGTNPAPSPPNSVNCPAGQYVFGANINLSATPAAGWQVSSWTGTTNDNSTLTSNTITMPAANHAASVVYSQNCYTLSTSVSPENSGVISASPEPNCQETKYASGSVVQLTAQPNPGHVFNQWSGALTGSTNPTTLSMSGNKTVSANFNQACYQLVLTHSGEGSDPDASPNQSAGCDPGTYLVGASVSLTAAPDSGWQVENWEGSNNDNSSSTSNNLTMPAEEHIVKVNYIEKPTLQFNAGSYTVNEDGDELTIQVLRTGSLAESVTVKVKTNNGSANSGQDFVSLNQTLTFGSNVDTRSVTISILDDNTAEGSETFNLLLSNVSSNAQLGTPFSAEATILDDEGSPTVQFSTSTFAIDETAVSAPVTITLFPISTDSVFVDLTAVAETATAGDDFITFNETLRFWPGETTIVKNILLLDDALDEPNESVSMTLSGVFGANLGESEASLTIIDDDDPPLVQFSSSEFFALEGDETAVMTVTLSSPSGYPISVDYMINDVSQSGPSNPSLADTLTFDPGTQEQVILAPISGMQAGDESIALLSTPEHAELGIPSTARLFILDEDRSDCYTLTRSHTGVGSDPLATNLQHSLGCGADEYVAGELISLEAVPEVGWTVKAWDGTLNNATTALNNVVQMPDSDHIIKVDYRTAVYFPGVFNNFISYFVGPNENEPNDKFVSANGPIQSGVVYFGNFETISDVEDIYYFHTPKDGNVQIELSSIPGSHNYDLYLYDSNGNLKGYSALFNNANENISNILTPGLYYVRIRRISNTTSSNFYELKVTYD